MKWLCYIVFCFPILGFSQTWKFNEEAKEILNATDSLLEIGDQTASKSEYDFLSHGTELLENLCLSKLKSLSKNKPDVMQESETLSAMAHLATKHWKGSHYSDSKKWGRLDKYFRRATYGTTSKFNIMQQVSFRIPLVKKSGGNFYYDAKGELGGLNLYSGKKPKTKQEREENQAFPLKNYTEEELIALFLRQVQKKRLYSDIRSGRIAFVGLSIEVDENSLYHSRIPTARVVLVVGARRMRNVPGKFQQVSLTEETSESSAQE